MRLEDLKDLPYIVIFRDEKTIRILEFDGPDAQRKAIAASYSGFEGCVIVAVRIKQTCPGRLQHLMS